MTDLEIIGEEIKAEWRRLSASAKESAERLSKLTEERAPMLAAITRARRGDVRAIPDLLRSGRDLSADDRASLAQYVEGGFDVPKEAGAPKGNARWVAGQALRFVGDWKGRAKLRGVQTYGSASQMRDEAIDFILAEYVPPQIEIDREAIIETMRRGKNRQN